MNEIPKHIKKFTEEYTAWCGEVIPVFDFYFKNIDHAALNIETHGHKLICRDCIDKIITCLQEEFIR